MYLHSEYATNGGEVVAPLRDSQKTLRWARSISLKRNMRDPSGKVVVRKDEVQMIRGSGGKIGVHLVVG